jgi:hypothetical protein
MKRAIQVGVAIGVAACMALLWRPLYAQRGGCSVPSNHGALKAYSAPSMVFEAKDGTIRVVNVHDCTLVYTIDRP